MLQRIVGGLRVATSPAHAAPSPSLASAALSPTRQPPPAPTHLLGAAQPQPQPQPQRTLSAALAQLGQGSAPDGARGATQLHGAPLLFATPAAAPPPLQQPQPQQGTRLIITRPYTIGMAAPAAQPPPQPLAVHPHHLHVIQSAPARAPAAPQPQSSPQQQPLGSNARQRAPAPQRQQLVLQDAPGGGQRLVVVTQGGGTLQEAQQPQQQLQQQQAPALQPQPEHRVLQAVQLTPALFGGYGGGGGGGNNGGLFGAGYRIVAPAQAQAPAAAAGGELQLQVQELPFRYRSNTTAYRIVAIEGQSQPPPPQQQQQQLLLPMHPHHQSVLSTMPRLWAGDPAAPQSQHAGAGGASLLASLATGQAPLPEARKGQSRRQRVWGGGQQPPPQQQQQQQAEDGEGGGGGGAQPAAAASGTTRSATGAELQPARSLGAARSTAAMAQAPGEGLRSGETPPRRRFTIDFDVDDAPPPSAREGQAAQLQLGRERRLQSGAGRPESTWRLRYRRALVMQAWRLARRAAGLPDEPQEGLLAAANAVLLRNAAAADAEAGDAAAGEEGGGEAVEGDAAAAAAPRSGGAQEEEGDEEERQRRARRRKTARAAAEGVTLPSPIHAPRPAALLTAASEQPASPQQQQQQQQQPPEVSALEAALAARSEAIARRHRGLLQPAEAVLPARPQAPAAARRLQGLLQPDEGAAATLEQPPPQQQQQLQQQQQPAAKSPLPSEKRPGAWLERTVMLTPVPPAPAPARPAAASQARTFGGLPGSRPRPRNYGAAPPGAHAGGSLPGGVGAVGNGTLLPTRLTARAGPGSGGGGGGAGGAGGGVLFVRVPPPSQLQQDDDGGGGGGGGAGDALLQLPGGVAGAAAAAAPVQQLLGRLPGSAPRSRGAPDPAVKRSRSKPWGATRREWGGPHPMPSFLGLEGPDGDGGDGAPRADGGSNDGAAAAANGGDGSGPVATAAAAEPATARPGGAKALAPGRLLPPAQRRAPRASSGSAGGGGGGASSSRGTSPPLEGRLLPGGKVLRAHRTPPPPLYSPEAVVRARPKQPAAGRGGGGGGGAGGGPGATGRRKAGRGGRTPPPPGHPGAVSTYAPLLARVKAQLASMRLEEHQVATYNAEGWKGRRCGAGAYGRRRRLLGGGPTGALLGGARDQLGKRRMWLRVAWRVACMAPRRLGLQTCGGCAVVSVGCCGVRSRERVQLTTELQAALASLKRRAGSIRQVRGVGVHPPGAGGGVG